MPRTRRVICLEAVQRIDALFDIEREINGHPAETRQAARKALSGPVMADLHRWLGEQRGKLARGNDVVRAIDLLKRWTAFTRFWTTGGSASQTTPRSGRSGDRP